MIRIPDSISAMVYSMRHPYLWTLMVWAVAVIGYCLMASASESLLPLAFASCACIAFVGCMPLTRGEHNTEHWILGVAGCAITQVWCVMVAGLFPMLLWWWVYLVLMAVLVCTERAHTWCFWMEVWCMAGVAGVALRAMDVI